jgi:O-methyltransferase involved in polyketide biosynthesis
MPDPKEEFHDVMEQLIALGETKEELLYWESLFDELTPEEQDEILSTLKEELAALKPK